MACRIVRVISAALLVSCFVVPRAGAIAPLATGAMASPNIELLDTIPGPAIGGKVVDGRLYVTGPAGLRVFDVSVPARPRLLGSLVLPHYENENVDTNGRLLLIAADHLVGWFNVLYVVDVSNPRAPALLAQLGLPGVRAHTATCIQDCAYAWVSGGSSIGVVDLRNPAAPKLAGEFYQDGTAKDKNGDFGWASHNVELDDRGVAWVSSAAGVFAYDATDPVRPRKLAGLRNRAKNAFDNDYIVHNTTRPDGRAVNGERLKNNRIDPGEVLLVTEENYDTTNNTMCRDEGRFQTGWIRRKDGRLKLEKLDAFRLGAPMTPTSAKVQPLVNCSAHWFSIRGSLVAVAWYEQGVRFFDVSNPRRIRESGYYVPATGETWDTEFYRDVLYVFDEVRGIDVLYVGPPDESTAMTLPPLKAPSGASRPSPLFGLSCRLPAAA